MLFTEADPGSAMTAAGTVVLWASLLICTACARNLARRLAATLTPPERCLVLGDPDQARRLSQKLDCHGGMHAEIVASIPFEEFELRRPRKGNFADYVAGRGIDRVIVGNCGERERVLEAVRYFKDYELKVSVLPDLLEVVGSGVEFDEIHGTTLLGVRHFGLSRSSQVLKRALDLAGSGVLLIALAPVMALIAAAVRLESDGPAFFKQTRVGKDGERFTMFKFRTMFDGADQLRDELRELNGDDDLFKLVEDPRITGIGRFLRRTSLDELPQLLNVFLGEMSLVGPRPLIEEEDAKVVGWHRRRLHLKPGMTGAWQIMGETRDPLAEMVSMDYLYIVNWSVWADTRILLQTIGHVFGRRGL
jgi:exopolysaccharide biosynthesis polyprenyl glycosylphosphotransferase